MRAIWITNELLNKIHEHIRDYGPVLCSLEISFSILKGAKIVRPEGVGQPFRDHENLRPIVRAEYIQGQ